MAKRPIELSKARVLITNDDGIDAPGIHLLERVVRQFSDDVWVVAPEAEQSAAGHSLTLRRPLRIIDRGPHRYAVDGTPTDAVLMAVKELMRDGPPDLVVSGINRGGNLGEDITYSGTVAAAMEATLLGLPAIALSQDMAPGGQPRWETAERFAPDVLVRLAASSWPAGVLINVNFPDRPPEEVIGLRAVRQGRRKPGGRIVRGVDPAGRPYYWIGTTRELEERGHETDLEAVHAGAVAVGPLHLDLTHVPSVRALKEQFE